MCEFRESVVLVKPWHHPSWVLKQVPLYRRWLPKQNGCCFISAHVAWNLWSTHDRLRLIIQCYDVELYCKILFVWSSRHCAEKALIQKLIPYKKWKIALPMQASSELHPWPGSWSFTPLCHQGLHLHPLKSLGFGSTFSGLFGFRDELERFSGIT